MAFQTVFKLLLYVNGMDDDKSQTTCSEKFAEKSCARSDSRPMIELLKVHNSYEVY